MTERYQDDQHERDLRDAGRGHLSMFGPTVDRADLERKRAREDVLWANTDALTGEGDGAGGGELPAVEADDCCRTAVAGCSSAALGSASPVSASFGRIFWTGFLVVYLAFAIWVLVTW